MGYTTLGSQTGDKPKTPTLRQYLQRNNGVVAASTNVTTIFRPGKFGGWSLVCDGRFRVEVSPENELFKVFEENFSGFASEGVTLVVTVDDVDKVVWSLQVNEDWESEWDVKPWGAILKLSKQKKTSPDSGKATRKSRETGGAA